LTGADTAPPTTAGGLPSRPQGASQQAAASVVSSSFVVGDSDGVPEVLDEDEVEEEAEVEAGADVGLALVALTTSARILAKSGWATSMTVLVNGRLRTVPVFWMRSIRGTQAGSWAWPMSTLTCSWSTLASAG
jgi:hypothetical protein